MQPMAKSHHDVLILQTSTIVSLDDVIVLCRHICAISVLRQYRPLVLTPTFYAMFLCPKTLAVKGESSKARCHVR